MRIHINGKEENIPNNSMLIDILKIQKMVDAKGVAIAVNNTVVLKQLWNTFKLNENDNILIIKATQGG